MSKVNNFDVLREMGERNLDIRGFPLNENLAEANAGKKNGRITMLVNPETVYDLLSSKRLIGMLIICDEEQFHQVKAEMESESAT